MSGKEVLSLEIEKSRVLQSGSFMDRYNNREGMAFRKMGIIKLIGGIVVYVTNN